MLDPFRRLLLTLAIGLPLVVLIATGLYMLGMAYLEGEPRGFWRALEWAGETLTTTGYGADARWDHPLMILFVVSLQFGGVFLVFLIIPIVLVRQLESRFELKLPREAPDMRDHVVIYRLRPSCLDLACRARGRRHPWSRH